MMIGIIEQELCRNGYYMMVRSVIDKEDVSESLERPVPFHKI